MIHVIKHNRTAWLMLPVSLLLALTAHAQFEDSQFRPLAQYVIEGNFEEAMTLLHTCELWDTHKRAMETTLAGLHQMPQRLVQSFAEDEGNVLALPFLDGTEKVQILGVGLEQIAARRRDVAGNFRVFLFTPDDLSAREQFERLNGVTAEEHVIDVARGLIALEANKMELAQANFEKANCPLGKLLLAHMGDDGETIRDAAEGKFKQLTEEAFEQVFAQLQKDNPEVEDLAAHVDFKEGDGYRNLNFYNCRELVDLSALTGYKIISLRLWNTGVTDLSPVANPALRRLNIQATPIESLEPLRGIPLVAFRSGETIEPRDVFNTMQLQELDLSWAKVKDIGFLTGVKLESLDLTNCSVNDLSPLTGMRDSLQALEIGPEYPDNLQVLWRFENLESLVLKGGSLHGIGSLRNLKLKRFAAHGKNIHISNLYDFANMPLETLVLDCAGVRDISPLRRVKTLKLLAVPAGTRGVEKLRQLPNLERIALIEEESGVQWKTAEDVWEMLDAIRRR